MTPALHRIAHNAPPSDAPTGTAISPTLALIVAWCALCAACVAAVLTGYPAGLAGLVALGVAAWAFCDVEARR